MARKGKVGKRDKRIPDENKSRLGAHSDLSTAGSGMESKKPRGKDTLYAHEDILNYDSKCNAK